MVSLAVVSAAAASAAVVVEELDIEQHAVLLHYSGEDCRPWRLHSEPRSPHLVVQQQVFRVEVVSLFERVWWRPRRSSPVVVRQTDLGFEERLLGWL